MKVDIPLVLFLHANRSWLKWVRTDWTRKRLPQVLSPQSFSGELYLGRRGIMSPSRSGNSPGISEEKREDAAGGLDSSTSKFLLPGLSLERADSMMDSWKWDFLFESPVSVALCELSLMLISSYGEKNVDLFTLCLTLKSISKILVIIR